MTDAVDVDAVEPGADDIEVRDGSGQRPDPRPRPRRALGRTVIRGIGQTMITFGVIALLFVVYELTVVNFLTDRHQEQLSQEIHQQWRQQPPQPDQPTVTSPQGAAPASAPAALPAIKVGVGKPFAVIHIPRLGGNWVVVEGVSQKQLAQGPGHYIGTAMPGEQGNFAVAGHAIRSVFLAEGDLRPGDPIVVETADHWFVYRVLGNPATGSYLGDASGIPGKETVLPTAIQVIAPTPDATGPATGAYLTLTTCTPATTATHRLIVHARLDGQPISKASSPGGPAALHG